MEGLYRHCWWNLLIDVYTRLAQSTYPPNCLCGGNICCVGVISRRMPTRRKPTIDQWPGVGYRPVAQVHLCMHDSNVWIRYWLVGSRALGRSEYFFLRPSTGLFAPPQHPHIRPLWGPVRAMKTLTSHVLHIIIYAFPLPPSSMLNQLGVGSACDENAHFCKWCARPRPSTLNSGGKGGDDDGHALTDERFYRTHRKDLFVVRRVCRVKVSHSFNNYLVFHSAWLGA